MPPTEPPAAGAGAATLPALPPLLGLRVAAIDPGPEQSAYVLWDGAELLEHGYAENAAVLSWLDAVEADVLVVEMIASYGLAVGATVFATCVWIGRYVERWRGRHELLTRPAVKMHLCGSMRAKDPHVRQALIDRFGGPGTRCPECAGKGWRGRGRPPCEPCGGSGWREPPGVCAELSGDRWAAMAVAVTWLDQSG